MEDDTITFEDVLFGVLLEIEETLSSGDRNTTKLRTEVQNSVSGPWAPNDDEWVLMDDVEGPVFYLELDRTWYLSPTDPLGQLETLEAIGAAYRMVARDTDLTLIHRLPPDGVLPNPHGAGTPHHRFWETHFSLEGARLGLSALEATDLTVEHDDDDEESDASFTLRYSTSLTVLGNDEDGDDCEYYLRLDLSGSTVAEVFRRIAAGSEPDEAMLAVTGTAEVTVLD